MNSNDGSAPALDRIKTVYEPQKDPMEIKTWWPPTVTAPTLTDAMLEADDPSTECHCHD